MQSTKGSKKRNKKVWSRERALNYVRSYYRKDLSPSELRTLINNSRPAEVPELSANLFYIAYNLFRSSSNTTVINLLDCNFCKCVSCIRLFARPRQVFNLWYMFLY